MFAASLSTIIKNNALFKHLSEFEQKSLKQLIYKFAIPLNGIIPAKIAKDSILFVLRGKAHIEIMGKDGRCVAIQEIKAGELWSGLDLDYAIIENIIIKASAPTGLRQLRLSDLYYQPEYDHIYKKIISGIKNSEAQLLFTERKNVWRLNQSELKRRAAGMQNFVTLLISLLSLYVLLLHHLQILIGASHGHHLKVIGTFLAVTCFGIFWLFKNSDFTLAELGLTVTNSAVAIKNGVIASAALIIGVTIVKEIFIIVTQQDIPLFNFQLIYGRYNFDTAFYLQAVFFYIFLSVPLQELVFRIGLQGFLQQIFSNRRTMWTPIILTNFLFCSMHVIISPYFALAVFIPGLVWSWLFAKFHNIIGVWVSHAIVGVYCVFVLEIFQLFNFHVPL